jgi:aminoglycoside 6'-N-acetyltransferase
LHEVSEGPDQTVVSLRPATAEDRFRVRRWLAEPDVHAVWGNAASAEAEINLAMGSASALCRIIECGVTAVGYVHALEAGLFGDDRPADLVPGTWHVNLLVASGQHSRRDLGSTALALLTDELFTSTLAVACAGLVSIRSEASVRAYERAGFHWRRIWDDRLLGPAWLMLKERPR